MQTAINAIDSYVRAIHEALNYAGHSASPDLSEVRRHLYLEEANRLRDVIAEIAAGTLGESQDIRDYAKRQLDALPPIPPFDPSALQNMIG